MKGFLSNLRDALSGAQGELDALRTKIEDLKDQRDQVENAPRARAEVERAVDHLIAEAQASDPFELGALWSVHTRPFEAVTAFNSAAVGRAIPGGGFASGNAFAVLAVWDPARLKSLIVAHAPEGITDANRIKALAKLDAEIPAAEIAEEIACRALEAETGITTLRRVDDVDLAILLAPHSELEAVRK